LEKMFNQKSANNDRNQQHPNDAIFPQASDFKEVDEMLLEYLLFRGFTRSFRAVAADCRSDRIRSFEADKVVAELLELIQSFDLHGFHSLWSFLDARFFSHLDAQHSRTVADLRSRLDKLCLIHAIRSDRKDIAHAFFSLYGADLHRRGGQKGRAEESSGTGLSWSDWFALPYLNDPASDPQFAVYFTSNWVAQLKLSLMNFITLVFRATPLPKLLLLEKWHRAESQQQLKRDLGNQRSETEFVLRKLQIAERQVGLLLGTTLDLVGHVLRSSVDQARKERGSVRGTLFDDDEHAHARVLRVREEGASLINLAKHCADSHHHHLISSPTSSTQAEESNTAHTTSSMNTTNNVDPVSDGDKVDSLVVDVRKWLKGLDVDDTS